MILALAAAAVAAGGLGSIDFPTSGRPAAQQRFLTGVLLLHSFEYDDARREFQAARKIDSGFAMAFWGEAMTHNEPVWFFQDAEAGRAVLRQAASLEAPTAREKDYLAAAGILFGPGEKSTRDIAYAEAMRRLHRSYPDDLEAAAFYALALLGTSHRGRDFAIYMRAAAVLEDVAARNPRHPGALHYLIHSYDDPVHAPLGLRAARVYAKVAPAAAHALHMPSHIFGALGLWDEYVKSNEDSWAASEERVRRESLGVEHRGFHALWWLEYGYLQQGRIREARKLLAIAAADAARSPAAIVQSHLAQMRAHYAIETGEAAPVPAPRGPKLDSLAAASDRFAQGYLAIRAKQRAAAASFLKALQTPPASHQATAHRDQHYQPDMQAIAIMEKQLEGLLLLHDGNTATAIDALRQAADLEDAMPYEFGPPAPPKPAHELLGETLLASGYAPQAQAQFELALRRAPRRGLSLLGLARSAAKAGDAQTSTETYAELRRIRHRAD
jgi:hypothetical protein